VRGKAGNFAVAFLKTMMCKLRSGNIWPAGLLAALLLSVALPLPAADSVAITEFLASNANGLRDENGDASDWIELFNSGTTNVSLDGWFLTDTPGNLTKWRFPATNIAPNGFVLVFASGKDRAIAGAPLHANFQLSAGGEYLALTRPDGVSVVSEFAPAFPEQQANISYGLGQDVQVTALISNASPARVFVPTNSNLGTTWTAVAFDDSAWLAGPTAWATRTRFQVSPCGTFAPTAACATWARPTPCSRRRPCRPASSPPTPPWSIT
jgi:hypothetical protein